MTIEEIMTGYKGSKDIRQHPYYQGALNSWVWKLYHHRLTQSGRWFLGATVPMFGIIALYWSLDTLTHQLALYATALWIVAIVFSLRPLPVRASMHHAERVRTGETLSVQIELSHTGTIPIPELGLVWWGLPQGLEAETEEASPLGLLMQQQSAQATLKIQCLQRGAYVLSGCRAVTSFPFGLLTAYKILNLPSRLLVHPSYTPLTHFDLPTGRRYQPGGISLASEIGDSFEYQGSREFRTGDRLRDIDWRSTARHATSPSAPLIVREWREEYFLRVGVVLDTHIPGFGQKKPRGLFNNELRERLSKDSGLSARYAALERAVSLCASISDALARSEYIVDLFAAGPELFHLTAGRSLAYREQILDILACVEGCPEEPLSKVAPRLVEDLAQLTTVICIVLDWDAPRQAFVERLQQEGVGVKVLWVSESEDAQPSDDFVRVLPPSAFHSGGIADL
jgi:uncharacterized protein (DUF58 family)